MKSALLGHNNDALPRECFIHGEDKQSYGTPLWLEFHKDKKSSERIKSDLASNGKAIVIEKPSKKVEGEVFFECPLLFYTLQHSELSLMSSQKFWFSYFSFSYTLSNSFQYGLVADYTTEGNIKLSGRKVDDENIRIRNWIDDIELYTIELQLEEVYDINVFLNFTLDDKTGITTLYISLILPLDCLSIN
uniref:Uncharacterized protein n=1 Tax=Clytia hemisphaerica TaxID=252671 RepID=A0A7M6DPU4_9CNID